MSNWSGYYADNIRQTKEPVLGFGPPEWTFDVYDKAGSKVLSDCTTLTWSEGGPLYDDIRRSMINWLKRDKLENGRVYV